MYAFVGYVFVVVVVVLLCCCFVSVLSVRSVLSVLSVLCVCVCVVQPPTLGRVFWAAKILVSPSGGWV